MGFFEEVIQFLGLNLPLWGGALGCVKEGRVMQRNRKQLCAPNLVGCWEFSSACWLVLVTYKASRLFIHRLGR